MKTLGVVATGGTLGSRLTNGSDVVLSGDHHEPPEFTLVERIAERRSIRLIGRSPLRVSSEDIQPDQWIRIAEACRALQAIDVDGILVLHGTDTAAYTSAALSFFLADVACPVAVTGANIPPGTENSDAETNINGSLEALGSLERSTVLAFAGAPGAPVFVHSGTHVRKTGRRGATFESINRPVVATVDQDSVVVPPDPKEAPLSASPVVSSIRADVALLRCHPGADMVTLADAMLAGGTSGVVLELFESFTGPTLDGGTRNSITEFARRCVEGGVPVFGVTASGAPGHVKYYESTRRLEDSGAVLLPGILPETTTVKLMIGLAQPDNSDPSVLVAWMKAPLADEFVELLAEQHE